MPVKFYTTRGDFGTFTNFSRHPIELKGKIWPTTEHYFQAQKYAGTEWEEHVRLQPTPRKAADEGRRRDLPLREDWENVKDDIMRDAVRRKVFQHSDVRDQLLKTGNEVIIEDSPIDSYWGCGKSGTGKNMLGKILMEIREDVVNNRWQETCQVLNPV